MRITLIVALCLGGCSTTSSPLDIITPDQLTVGHGQGSHSGDAFRNDGYGAGYDGESESTYAALTWNLPSFKDDDDRLTREERHAIREFWLNADAEAVAATSTTLNLREGVTPPDWLPYAIGGGLLSFLLLVFLKSRRTNGWH